MPCPPGRLPAAREVEDGSRKEAEGLPLSPHRGSAGIKAIAPADLIVPPGAKVSPATRGPDRCNGPSQRVLLGRPRRPPGGAKHVAHHPLLPSA
eukprot:14005533-Alexandrium_andersonii.AAC.1